MVVVATMMVERTERGDEMFMSWLARDRAADPRPRRARAAARSRARRRRCRCVRSPSTRAATSRDPSRCGTRSWYFDAVADDESLGVYVRLGRLPNQGVSLYTASRSAARTGRRSWWSTRAAPLPDAGDDAQAIETEWFHAEQRCELAARALPGEAPGPRAGARGPVGAAPRRSGRAGRRRARPRVGDRRDPVRVAPDDPLRDPVPGHAARCASATSRSRSPVPGQRDHSWGSRDWWAFDWMWSALHLDDGTHTHAVAIPQLPGFGVGYVQRGGVDRRDHLGRGNGDGRCRTG